jgi:hypothetical protein
LVLLHLPFFNASSAIGVIKLAMFYAAGKNLRKLEK